MSTLWTTICIQSDMVYYFLYVSKWPLICQRIFIYFWPKINFFKTGIGWKEHCQNSHLYIVCMVYYFLYVPYWLILYVSKFPLICQRIFIYFWPKITFFSNRIGWKEHSQDHHLHIVCMMYYFLYVPYWLIFQRIFNKKIDIYKSVFTIPYHLTWGYIIYI